jgi:hypothetical protein
VDEVALIRDTISHYAPVLIALLSNPSRRRVGEFFSAKIARGSASALFMSTAIRRIPVRLLRACRKWPRGRDAEKSNELSPPHSRTSLARATNASDKETPSDAAIFRLTAM